MITLEVLGKQDEVVTALVGLALLVLQTPPGNVDFAADDGLEIGLRLQRGDFLAADGRGVAELLVHDVELVDMGLGLGVLLGILGRIVLPPLHKHQRVALLGHVNLKVGDLAEQLFERGERLLQILDAVVLLVILLLNVVEELLDAEHIAVVGHGDAGLSVGHRLVNQLGNTGLTVEYRILGMDVQMAECGHGNRRLNDRGEIRRRPVRRRELFRYGKYNAIYAEFLGKALAIYQQNA